MSALPLPTLAMPPADTVQRARESFSDFIEAYRDKLSHLFGTRHDLDSGGTERGVAPFVIQRFRDVDPLSVYVPEQYGGRGGTIGHSLTVLEETSYHSLPLSLIVGINGGLFLQPVAKYATEEAKQHVLPSYVRDRKFAGLMITEPDYGSEALSMETGWRETDRGTIRIEGTKHWAGLTGWADYWLLTARPRTSSGGLRRDVDFFIADANQPGQHVEVEELYPNLGLKMIPYGRNRVDVEVPQAARLEPHSTGVKMMLDTLHRSRLQIPGMGMGYLRRIFDDALDHARERFVGGKPLLDYDQVRARLARLQSFVTGTAAMCMETAGTAGVDRDLFGDGLKANAFKTVVTDWMQEAAQSFLQLMGAQGYREDHRAGRALVDSRPYQIFEGSNDILYQQVTEAVVKAMRRLKEADLGAYLREEPLTARAAATFGDSLSFDVDWSMPQRKLVDLGRAISRIVTMEMTIELGERGFSSELVSNMLEETRAEVRSILETYRGRGLTGVVEGAGAPEWLARVRPAG
ncbi:acyl-CoA dehydrogenase family protein [Rubrivirga marina]|uniref:Acyl-CoA dehydrogenase n=1 Tax=Rubrivirga marina TaxID=1196024 RepID=A0A271J4C6_9BACT|nr:acyl-CoA dehydrogenase family protein [Rubrivirga marina]PAP77805.1 acyl-CoA dehydrogenase [Rubrivirga marina]